MDKEIEDLYRELKIRLDTRRMEKESYGIYTYDLSKKSYLDNKTSMLVYGRS